MDKLQSNIMLEDEPESFHLSTVHNLEVALSQMYTTTLNWGGVELKMQVGTRSLMCVIAKERYRRCASLRPQLEPTDKMLHCYTGKLPHMGKPFQPMVSFT